MRRPNIDRMRKHAARSTPDTVSRLFDEMTIIDNDVVVHEWIQRTIRKFQTKYGALNNNVEIEVSQNTDLYRNEVLITVHAITDPVRIQQIRNRRHNDVVTRLVGI